MLMHLKAKAKEKDDSHDIDKKLVVPIKMLSALDHMLGEMDVSINL